MSSSWKRFLLQNINNFRTPSPTFSRVLSNPISRVKKWLEKFCVERISVLASECCIRNFHGSMTVEATLLLPLVLFFFLHIMSVVEMLRLHGKLSLALWECGNQLTVYASMPEEVGTELPDVAVSYLYVGNRVEKFLGKDYLNNSPLIQGSKGLNYLASDYEGNCIDIGVTYRVAPQMTLFPLPYMRMVNRYYGHDWTGFDAGEGVKYVYVTLYGEVWHETAECTHIFITVLEADRAEIKVLRNLAGEKYSICALCREGEQREVVYYTEQGNRYHKSKECSSLTRYISAIPWKEDLPYRACSRCVKEEEGN